MHFNIAILLLFKVSRSCGRRSNTFRFIPVHLLHFPCHSGSSAQLHCKLKCLQSDALHCFVLCMRTAEVSRWNGTPRHSSHARITCAGLETGETLIQAAQGTCYYLSQCDGNSRERLRHNAGTRTVLDLGSNMAQYRRICLFHPESFTYFFQFISYGDVLRAHFLAFAAFDAFVCAFFAAVDNGPFFFVQR